jgi:hypothetical protein
MVTFTKPANLNGSELRAELRQNGVAIDDDIYSVILTNDQLGLKIAEADKDKASAVVAAHNGTTVAPEATVETKLASVGLSIEDLKAALLG